VYDFALSSLMCGSFALMHQGANLYCDWVRAVTWPSAPVWNVGGCKVAVESGWYIRGC